MDIDETGTDDLALGIYLNGACCICQVSYFGNDIALDGDVALVALLAAAIDNSTLANEQIVMHIVLPVIMDERFGSLFIPKSGMCE
jgi:hypothetical protein